MLQETSVVLPGSAFAKKGLAQSRTFGIILRRNKALISQVIVAERVVIRLNLKTRTPIRLSIKPSIATTDGLGVTSSGWLSCPCLLYG